MPVEAVFKQYAVGCYSPAKGTRALSLLRDSQRKIFSLIYVISS
jgi:hypothetical protein